MGMGSPKFHVEEEMVRILTLIGSAGRDPWLSIEKEAQEPIITQMKDVPGPVLWISVDPRLDDLVVVKFLAKLLGRQIDAAYSSIFFTRRLAKNVLRRRGYRAFGHSLYRRMSSFWLSSGSREINPTRIMLSFPSAMSLKPLKTVAALRYGLENYDFDFVLRITSTCLPVYEEVISFVKRLPSKRVYAGLPLSFAGVDFASGAAILMSRDVVEGVVKNSADYPSGVFEDVGLGWLIANLELAELIPMERVEVRHITDVGSPEVSSWPAAPVVRCKAEEPKTKSAQQVVENMWATWREICRRSENTDISPS